MALIARGNQAMSDFTKVAFYSGMTKRDHLLDVLVQYDPPAHWVPAIADFNSNRNLSQFMELVNVSPAAWQAHLIEKYGFDPAAPTQEGLANAGVAQDRLSSAFPRALEQQENWEVPETFLWSYDDEKPPFMTPAQVEEVIAESRGRGTPVIVFEALADEVEKALADDNEITVSGLTGIYVGLSDPVNGLGWSPENFLGPITFRPSIKGVVVLGDHGVFENLVEDAYRSTVSFVPGEPLRYSSRSEDTMRFGPPEVRDERSTSTGFGM
jgi:hypothetical protein